MDIDVAVAVVECDDRFLIGQRPQGTTLAGFWEFPGGKVRSGETAADAAVRECREETGINIEILGSFGERSHAYDFGRVHLQFFASRPLDASRHPLPPFRWVERRELIHYEFPPANADVLKILRKAAPDQRDAALASRRDGCC